METLTAVGLGADMDDISRQYLVGPKYHLFWEVFSQSGIICVGTCGLDISRCLSLGLKVL